MFRDESGPDGLKNLESFTSNKDFVKAQISALTSEGGGDRHGPLLFALFKAASDCSIGWRGNSSRILLFFGDHPGHEPSCIQGLR